MDSPRKRQKLSRDGAKHLVPGRRDLFLDTVKRLAQKYDPVNLGMARQREGYIGDSDSGGDDDYNDDDDYAAAAKPNSNVKSGRLSSKTDKLIRKTFLAPESEYERPSETAKLHRDYDNQMRKQQLMFESETARQKNFLRMLNQAVDELYRRAMGFNPLNNEQFKIAVEEIVPATGLVNSLCFWYNRTGIKLLVEVEYAFDKYIDLAHAKFRQKKIESDNLLVEISTLTNTAKAMVGDELRLVKELAAATDNKSAAAASGIATELGQIRRAITKLTIDIAGKKHEHMARVSDYKKDRDQNKPDRQEITCLAVRKCLYGCISDLCDLINWPVPQTGFELLLLCSYVENQRIETSNGDVADVWDYFWPSKMAKGRIARLVELANRTPKPDEDPNKYALYFTGELHPNPWKFSYPYQNYRSIFFVEDWDARNRRAAARPTTAYARIQLLQRRSGRENSPTNENGDDVVYDSTNKP